MKLRFLGTGTSTGNPEIGCRCEVCTSPDRKDRRFRASALIETAEGCHILIDCGPDFRMQMLRVLSSHPVERLDAVLITHEHYDHVGGLDDLRTFSRDGAVDVYAESYVAEQIKLRIPYVFREQKYPGVPNLDLHKIEHKPFFAGGMEIIPVRLMHGCLPVFGYRIGALAYLTDLKTIPEVEYGKLENLEVLVINALRKEPHISHETIGDALANIERIRPRRAFLIHMNHHFGLHEAMQKTLPGNVFIAYDGLEINV
jgi:phosphoribosyl 1,2-cyclic phosphate phosphodiesterase